MRRWLARLAIGVALCAAAVAFYYTQLRPDPVPVTVFVVSRGIVEETVTNSKAGTVKTHHRARLGSEIGGRVAEIGARKGEQVAAGSVLIRLEDGQYRAQVVNAERALEAAREGEKEACLDADLAQRELARAERLAREEIISEELLDQAASRRDVSRASCDAARARAGQLGSQLQVARAELDKTVVRAPFDGVVAELTLELGEWITPSPPGVPMPTVLDLIDPQAIYVSAPLDEVDREKVRVGLPARLTLDAYPGRSFPGSVVRIAPYIVETAEQSRTFEVEANFEDAQFAASVPPGASADVEVILNARDDALRVPTYALLEGRSVLLLEDGKLVSREVAAGIRNWEFVEIASGLQEGERVVVSLDRAEVKEGARARQAAVAEK